jgi:hypothetical protein
MKEETTKIEDFHALLTSETEENQLIAALRQLTKLEKPEDVRALDKGTNSWWSGWAG